MTADPAALWRHATDDAPDADLLARFAVGRDDGAFALLVRRHGGTVFGVCRRMTGHRQDAEDAFQAVFLILARKADRLAHPDRLGNYLYGVAVRVAAKARRRAARRRESTLPDLSGSEPTPADPDLARVIDEELARLPGWYRDAVLLCDLHGLPRADAARRLGVPEGTLSSRLAAGRKKLADRLARRGVTAPAAGLAAALGGSATADVPAELVQRAVATAGGVVSAAVGQLAHGGSVMGTVFGWVGATAAVGLTVGAVAAWPGQKPDSPPTKPAVAAKPEDPKPAAANAERLPGRSVKILARATLTGGRAELPQWSPNGKWVAVQAGGTFHLIDGRALATRSSFQNSESPGAHTRLVGFDPSGANLIVNETVGGINGSNRLISRRTNAASERVAIDIEQGLTPIQVVDWPADWPTGTVVALGRNRRRELSVEAINPTDGSSRVLIDRTFPAGRFDGFGLSADGTRAGFVWEDERATTIEVVELPSGKSLWSREFNRWSDRPQPVYSPVAIAFSPDRSRMLVNFRGSLTDSAVKPDPPDSSGPKRGGRPTTLPKREVRVLDAGTGADISRPAGQVAGYNVGYGFSYDGRLLVGRVQADIDQSSQLCVWETATGKLLKSWDGQAEAVFAPDRPALVIIEHTASSKPSERGATLGLWDVSPLWK